ncbi:beta-galactosidase [Bacteroidota bacterium]
MTPKIISFLSAIIVFLSFFHSGCKHLDKTLPLVDFTVLDDEVIQSDGGIIEIIDSEGTKHLSVKSSESEIKTGVKIYSPRNSPWDLEGYHQVKSEVSNVGHNKIQVTMHVGNDPDGLIRWYCSDYVDLLPGETKTLNVDLSWTPWIHSPQPDIINMRGIPGRIKTPLEAIDQIAFSVRYDTPNSHFTVSRLYATGSTEVRDTSGFFPFVDPYGQYKHIDWPGKIHSTSELEAAAVQEKMDLNNNPQAPDRNEFGGWTAGPKLEATGYFRTEKVNGKWWLVDPSGCLFWSAGVNCVSAESVYTGLTNREHYFEEIPSDTGVYGSFYRQGRRRSRDNNIYKAFNFFAHNLYTKYGEDYLSIFRDLTHKRFKSWGLNTLGFVSDQELLAQQRTPYVGSVWIRGTTRIEGSEGYSGKFHDVFDPGFREIVRESVERQKFGAGDPWCIGYFVDNEMSWGKSGSLSTATLKSPPDQPAKQEFIKDLKAKYQDIEKLNGQWGTNHESWDALLSTTEIPDEELADEDLMEFYDKIARTYFRTVNEELKQVAPNQNYLGCRLAWAVNDITLQAAGDYCDIISFNKYEYSIEDLSLPVGVDKPIIIGEFHFGALDRGLVHVGVKAANSQEDRGLKYQNYIQGALRNNYIIGAHWFQYLDQPITGRGDGENYNVGLVDICNTPHTELLEKVRETCYNMYEYRDQHQE